MPRSKKYIVTIYIIDLRLLALIGVNDWEKRNRQKIIINASFDYDARQAVKSDQLGDTIDYKKVKQSIIRLIEKTQFQLLEKLVAAVLELIIQDPRVIQARVKIDKPGALRFAKSVAIEMTYPQS
jgi:D-erythro-7,8-dihydroneopterin triphosphate epimerase